MPMMHASGEEIPTPEETVAALIEQGVKPAEIIADAQAIIDETKAGIVWVDAEADNHVEIVNDRLRAHTVAAQALADAQRAGADLELVKKAEELHGETALDITLGSINSTDARVAQHYHRGHAQETIAFAERRIAAAQNPKGLDKGSYYADIPGVRA